MVSATWVFAIFTVGLLGAIATTLAKATAHLSHIRRMLSQLLDDRMEPQAFLDRMHKITLGATESAKHLKSIDERIEPITHTRFERQMDELIQRIEFRNSKKSDD